MLSTIKHITLFTILLFVFSFNIYSQEYPLDKYEYDFVNYDINKISFYNDSTKYINLYKQLNKLILRGEGQVKILHIGDSHIQADLFSGRMRSHFQTYFNNNAGRGLVFPFKIARSNTPFNYSCEYTGQWTSCRNVQQNKSNELGLMGISVTTTDSIATLKIILHDKNYLKYDFNKIKIFYNNDSSRYKIILDNYNENYTIITDTILRYSELKLSTYIDTLYLKFINTDTIKSKFSLYGISLETDDPGIVYNAVGVNGAEVNSYLRCSLFTNHLKAMQPDFIIISLGTNDSYTKTFNASAFYNNLDILITNIEKEAPNAAILLTIPADNYRKRKYKNPNVAKAKDEIIKIAKKYNCGVWDFYDIMGGYNSIVNWQKAGLTASDKLHFSTKGYLFQGDLLFNAFLKSYNRYIDTIKK